MAELAPVYASDPHYARSISQIISRHQLDRWDDLAVEGVDTLVASGLLEEHRAVHRVDKVDDDVAILTPNTTQFMPRDRHLGPVACRFV